MQLLVKASTISGRGVFAEQDIRKGQLIHRMGGRRISLARCIAEIAAGAIRIDDPLPVGKYEYLVLDEFSILFNHSCGANAGIANEVDLTALTDIPRGAEITFDYSMTVRASLFTAFWKMPCGCGASSCRGSVGDIRTVSEEHVQRYLQVGALQDFIVDSLNAGRGGVSVRSAAAK
jgi:uncharacterized protein